MPLWFQITSAIFGSTLLSTILTRFFAVKDKKKDKQDEILDEIKGVKTDLKAHKDDEMRYRADQARTRLLRFSDELRRGVKHSEESFNQALEDKDFYLGYCKENDGVYVNSKADAAIRNIDEVYDRCVRGELEFL